MAARRNYLSGYEFPILESKDIVAVLRSSGKFPPLTLDVLQQPGYYIHGGIPPLESGENTRRGTLHNTGGAMWWSG